MAEDTIIIKFITHEYLVALKYLDSGECTTPESAIISYNGQEYTVKFDLEFKFEYSEGMRIQNILINQWFSIWEKTLDQDEQSNVLFELKEKIYQDYHFNKRQKTFN